jgi:predicted AAA+ superfamily ATPase
MKYLKRSILPRIEQALKIAPAVLIAGARQIGKSTLVSRMKRDYIVMDDITQLSAATHDPQGYIENINKPITIDEIQKAAHLLTPIKLYIDKNRTNGAFLLTGSANVLSLKKSNESLAGRLIELTMYPFSARERNGDISSNLVDELFADKLSLKAVDKGNSAKLDQFVVTGGYPVAFKLSSAKERFLWFNSYISTYIERDVRSIGELRDLDNFIRFFNVVAPRTTKILNKSNIANDTSLTTITVDNYLSLLEKVYQIYLLKPYHENIGKTFVKSPKVFLTDSGIASHILGVRSRSDLPKSTHKGVIYETFVFAELLKHVSFSKHIVEIFYYRTQDKKEIDFVLKKGNEILAIEVKAAFSVSIKDFRHIIDFQNRSAHKVKGIIFYNGDKTVRFAKNLFAIPLAAIL